MAKLNLTDRAWLLADRQDMPLHVAGLAVFTLPPDAGPDYVSSMVTEFRVNRTFARPFNQRLRRGPLSRLIPWWEVLTDEQIDIDYHLRQSALPRPGGERELGTLVSRLQSRALDFTRPLWEFHVIEGLADNRFAMYLKVHHALIDGVGLMRRLTRMVSDDPTAPAVPVWAVGAPEPGATPTSKPAPKPSRPLRERITLGARSGKGFATAAAGIVREAVRPSNPVAATLFGGPRSVLNERVTPQRRVATQSFELDRLRRVAKASGATVNDVLLAISSSALRRYLLDVGELPRRNLTAGVPVSRRRGRDTTAGNAFSLLLVNLHTTTVRPLERLAAIAESGRLAKAELRKLPRTVADNFGLLVFGPFLGEVIVRLAGRTRPPCNLIISNVPGPRGALYFNGARLQQLYPASLVFDGIAVSITALSANDRFNIGIVGCRNALPHIQRLAVFHADALDELERALELPVPAQLRDRPPRLETG
jgi:WS/DGAT/MGAT family acyltransferase